MVRALRVLFLAAEASPFIKVGGLGDVAGELPHALHAAGAEVRVILPLHAHVDATGLRLSHATALRLESAEGGVSVTLLRSDYRGLPWFWVDAEPIWAARSVYEDPGSDGRKYVLYCVAAAAACEHLGWAPDIVHAHDWHAASALIGLAARRPSVSFWARTAGVLTIHNLAFMGGGGEHALTPWGLDVGEDLHLPEWARHMILPRGLAAADWITAVSPSYAEEIQTAEFGCGLEVFLSARRERLTGILNGIDTERWDPQTDGALAERYSASELTRRQANRRALQSELGLPEDRDAPLVASIGRLDPQKGIDYALPAMERLWDLRWQFVLLGTGDPTLEGQARAFEARYPDRARSILRFDPGLARRIYAGADLILVPSRYEPCGLTQLIGMRYGCLPIVRATGGLRDSVVDVADPDRGTGFAFRAAEAWDLEGAMRRAFAVFEDRRRWEAIQRRGMLSDFSWKRAAQQYLTVYRDAHQSLRA